MAIRLPCKSSFERCCARVCMGAYACERVRPCVRTCVGVCLRVSRSHRLPLALASSPSVDTSTSGLPATKNRRSLTGKTSKTSNKLVKPSALALTWPRFVDVLGFPRPEFPACSPRAPSSTVLRASPCSRAAVFSCSRVPVFCCSGILVTFY